MMKELFDLQREVDDIIETKIKTSFVRTLNERKVAFRVELSEFANEVGFFKYWKQSHKKDDFRIKDEWADCLAFLLSITLTKGHQDEITRRFENGFIKNLQIDIDQKYNQLTMNRLNDYINIEVAFLDLYGMGLKLGYSVDELNDAYRNKTKENIRRATEGY
ncbi:nucleoside triphosphate pyrophosphohydrolase [Bacillus phage DLc1]|uniref:dUTPase n=1 Tax=Bacillus phage DLc1 TaxID=2777318 RepID=A0A7M1RPE2_9CAUD|nr:nucleoside triphosphate pyrophosphohydrolase [Bacillus phage DLc1]QOR56255.1 hypothetical protein [Bacillus phage DLc1]